MADNTELFGTEGVAEETGQTPASPATNPQQVDRPTDPTPAAPAKVNWMEQPEFKQWQSRYDKQLTQAQREKQELANRLNAYEQQLEQLQTANLDEPGKIAYENQKLRRMNQMLLQQQQEQEGRQRVFNRIAATTASAGLSFSPDILADATDADDAWERAFKHFASNLPKQAAMMSEKREANAVDLGGGASSGEAAALQARYDKASAQYNTNEVLSIMLEADSRGVQLRL